MTISVRPATPDDAAAIHHLNEVYNDVRATVAQIREQLVRCQGTETALLAEVDGRVVGFLCLRLLPQITDARPYAEVSELFVEADFRRIGVARTLMDRAVAMAKDAGAAEVILMTGFKNTGGQRFYHNQGFENYCLAMKKQL
ncbi:MAG: GNAT family N-acetyltransferase [Caldilineaceae bacterium]|nr:GNAT family N-acetyltransferase [Caldilineaceae bacterium]